MWFVFLLIVCEVVNLWRFVSLRCAGAGAYVVIDNRKKEDHNAQETSSNDGDNTQETSSHDGNVGAFLMMKSSISLSNAPLVVLAWFICSLSLFFSVPSFRF